MPVRGPFAVHTVPLHPEDFKTNGLQDVSIQPLSVFPVAVLSTGQSAGMGDPAPVCRCTLCVALLRLATGVATRRAKGAASLSADGETR